MRITLSIVSSLFLLLGCGGHSVVGFTNEDAGPVDPDGGGPMPDGGAIVPGDASGMDAAPPSKKFFLMVTQTPAGDAPLSTWGGVARYDIADDNMPAKQGVGIDKSKVADPCGLAFRNRSAELFVGNRHGNQAADGVLGSISRFRYDRATEKFTPNGEITGNGLARVHQVTFTPSEDELFAANRDGGISRFTFDKSGNPIANGVLTANGWIRGVAVSPDGKRLYATTAGDIIRQFDLTNNGAELATVNVDTNANLHFMYVIGSQLYVPGVNSGYVYRFKIEANDSLSLVDKTMADQPISVALSPDKLELFAAGHVSSDLIDRFKATNSAWTATTQINTGWSLGMILVFGSDSSPATMPW